MVSKGVGVEVMFRYKINVDAKEWDLFLENHPQGNLLQSSDWSKIKDTWGNERVGFYKDNQLVGVANILIQPLPLGLSMFYIPRGPVIDYEDKELLKFVLLTLKKLAKKSHAIMVKFDPSLFISRGLIDQETVQNSMTLAIVEELKKNKYITERAVVFFKLLFEIIESELYKKVHNKKITLSSNIKLLNYLKFSLLNRDVEVFKVLFLNTQNELLKEEELFYGTIDKSTVYIRELVKKILEYNAKAVILVHNHPSGSLRPSESDILLTKKVKEVFESLEIRLLDHLIISEKGYFSFLEGGIL